ncbi:MAG: RDD family protein [Acidimicrobiia bacterium]|nr:RDD family protein [Acidimicrobiia bacterium]
MSPPPPPSMPPYASSAAAMTFNYASWGSRVGASLVRAFVFLPGYIVVLILGAINDGLGLLAYLLYAVFTFVAGIRMYIQRGHLGYDVGDRVTGQALILEATGAPMGNGMQVFIRGLAHIVDSLICCIGYLFPLWDAKRQTIADKIMSTVVITGRPQQHDAKTLVINSLELWKPVIKS